MHCDEARCGYEGATGVACTAALPELCAVKRADHKGCAVE